MPLELRNLKTNTATARVDYGEAGDINIVFRPENITEKTIRALDVLDDRSNERDILANTKAVNTVLCQLIVSLDLTLAGVPVPVTEEGFESVPFLIRMDMARAIVGAIRLDPTSASESAPRSPDSSAPAIAPSSRKRASRRSRTGSSASK